MKAISHQELEAVLGPHLRNVVEAVLGILDLVKSLHDGEEDVREPEPLPSSWARVLGPQGVEVLGPIRRIGNGCHGLRVEHTFVRDGSMATRIVDVHAVQYIAYMTEEEWQAEVATIEAVAARRIEAAS